MVDYNRLKISPHAGGRRTEQKNFRCLRPFPISLTEMRERAFILYSQISYGV